MIHVLVVDDEGRHRRGLVNLIQKNRPGFSISEEKNGKEALQLLLKTPVDIVITDIRMPQMNGLDLIAFLRENDIETEIIILTAYAQFDYAQRAVRLGAFDYVTKPVDPDKFLDILNLAEKQVILKRELYAKTAGKSKATIEQLLQQFVKQPPEPQETELFLAYLEEYGVQTCGWIVYTRFGGKFDSNAAGKEPLKALKDVLENEGNGSSAWKTVIFLLDEQADKAAALVLSNRDDVNEEQFADYWKDKLRRFDSSGPSYPVSGASMKTDFRLEAVQKACKQAELALNDHFYMDGEPLVLYSLLQQPVQILSHNSYKMEEELKSYVRMLDEGKAVETFRFWYKEMFNGGRAAPELLKEMILHLMMNMISVLQDFISVAEASRWMERLKSELMTSGNSQQLCERAELHLHDMIQTLRLVKDTRNERIVHQCITYIEEHFCEDLSLERVAEKFRFNTSYFSRLIKLHSGLSFRKYVNHLRIQRSVELLVATNSKVYEIAAQVGFSDVKYFIRVFKKETGAAPDEYRKMYTGT